MPQPPHKLFVPDEIKHLIKKLHPVIKKKIRHGLAAVLYNPQDGKTLRKQLTGLSSFKVGRFRIIYRVTINFVEIVAIGPRSTIYTDTWNKIKP